MVLVVWFSGWLCWVLFGFVDGVVDSCGYKMFTRY